MEGVDFTETEGRKLENSENRNISMSGEILSKSGQLAAANLAQCNPAGCKADFAGDEGEGLKFFNNQIFILFYASSIYISERHEKLDSKDDL